jgi:hypothetical protein
MMLYNQLFNKNSEVIILSACAFNFLMLLGAHLFTTCLHLCMKSDDLENFAFFFEGKVIVRMCITFSEDFGGSHFNLILEIVSAVGNLEANFL